MSVTISRQTGSGALLIAQKLADFLQAHCTGKRPWTVFDKNLMGKVLEDHNLPARLARFLPEDSISMINEMVDELLGLHPPSWTMVRQITETILHLVELGNVILIGRAGNIITSKLPNVFHVRLVAPLEKRVERIQEANQLRRKEAFEFIRRSDRGRARYLQQHFQASVADPQNYDLVVNTARFSDEEAVRLIGEAVLSRGRALSAINQEKLAPALEG